MAERSLNLATLACEHFELPHADVELATVQAAIDFAMVAIKAYQRLENEAIAELMEEREDDDDEDADDDEGPSVITAAELVSVVDLHRSLRGGHSAAGDLYHALNYLAYRDQQEADWELIMQELSELIPDDEEPATEE